MTRRWFGTDGIRGRAGEEPLVPDFLQKLGRVLGEEAGLVLLARDTRESGPWIAEALAAGLGAAGARVVDLGVLPTAGLPLAMRRRGAAAGVMVSASHNPWADNGIKIFASGGSKLSDQREVELERRVQAQDGPAAEGKACVERVDGAREYVEDLLRRFEGLDLGGQRVLVDCAHGAASRTAPEVLRRAGAEVTPLFCEPDGRNINEGCGSTHLGPLTARMQAGGFDAGLAFDGDADRVLLVDPGGRTVTGDHMLAFLAPRLRARGRLPHDTVVASVMSNLGLEQALRARDLLLHRAPVGDRHVLAAMAERGFGLGGEDSGHVLFALDGGEQGRFIGDGLYTALSLLREMKESGTDLASIVDAVPKVPQLLVNVKVKSKPPVASLKRLMEAQHRAEQRHGESVRILLRYSGTENLARVMVEGADAAVVKDLVDELARIWREEVGAG